MCSGQRHPVFQLLLAAQAGERLRYASLIRSTRGSAIRLSARSIPAWKAIEFKVGASSRRVPRRMHHPNQSTGMEDRSSTFPGQQTLLECKSSCCRVSGIGDVASSAHQLS